MGILIQAPLGALSDRIGRKPMLLIYQALMIASNLIRGSATSPLHLIVAGLVGGFVGVGVFGLFMSMTADAARPEERNRAIGNLYFFSSLGLFAGPLIASTLLSTHLVTIRVLHYLDAVARIVLIAFICFLIREKQREGVKSSYKGVVAELMRKRNLIVALVTAALFFFFFSVINTYIPIHAKQTIGLSDALIASLSTYRFLTAMMIRLAIVPLIEKMTMRRLLMGMLILSGLIGFSAPYTNDYVKLTIIMLILGVSFGAITPIGGILITDSSNPRNRGTANSIYAISTSSGLITPVLTAPIAEGLGIDYVFAICAFVPFIALLPVAVLMKPLERRI